ncbi:MAG: hypothetical protein A2Y94_11365 [Caldithrix sp. RBG_13_44_9]|nr:MAG: hypothetical protein A2Y94_11365 [Caldithrix sp. RBG_13_44_9]
MIKAIKFHNCTTRNKLKVLIQIQPKVAAKRMRVFLNSALVFGLLGSLITISNCDKENPVENPLPTYPDVDRKDKLPDDISKRGPDTDQHPPILHSTEFEEPVPLSSGINTAGAEDSPFILPDGNTLYFFFTPDVRVPAEQQFFDEVTGVWVSYKVNNEWEEAERVWLQDPGKLALDGAVAVQGNEIWFASAREGFTAVNMFTAEWVNNKWMNWKYSGDRLMKEIQIGEVHIHGDSLYFHSARTGGLGSFDIWVTNRNGDLWSDPINIEAVNSNEMDGWPFISSDGNELWFTRMNQGTPAIFRSLKNGGSWSAPELILSQFAGEPTLDNAANLYFVHHFYENGVMIEADIYAAYKK